MHKRQKLPAEEGIAGICYPSLSEIYRVSTLTVLSE